jgi:toxin ParE1/3/4
MAKVIWSSSADDDMLVINNFISIDSEFYAEKVIDRIYQRTSVLEAHIRIGKVVPEFKNSSIRELIEAPYRIIYRINNENEVLIVRVHHSARLLRKL